MKIALSRFMLGLVPAFIAGLFAVQVQAATVSIQAPAEVVLGQTFQVNYLVSGAQAVDTVRFNGGYSSEFIELKALASTKSLDSRSPSTGFNQVNGTYSFGAFTIAEPANGTANTGVFTFTAKEVGTATISLDPSSLVLSAGENQLTGTASAQIRIVAPKTTDIVRVPQTETTLNVSSASHPDENLWYTDRDVDISWKAEGSGVTSVFIAFDDQPEGPATEKVTNTGSKTFTAPDDGVWYAHIIVSFADGKRLRRDYRLQIDSTAPRAFALSADYEQVDPKITNYLRFSALDDVSGIRYYRVYDGGIFIATTTNPYFAINTFVGEHEFTVEAVDYADNVTKTSAKVRLGVMLNEAQASHLWWILLFGMLLVMLTGFIVGILLMKRRKDEEKADMKRTSLSTRRRKKKGFTK